MKDLSRPRRISENPNDHAFFLAVGVTVVLAVMSFSGISRGSYFFTEIPRDDSVGTRPVLQYTVADAPDRLMPD